MYRSLHPRQTQPSDLALSTVFRPYHDERDTRRELLYFLAWRDFTVRYKQTALGVAWAAIQPFFTRVVFLIFFG